MLALNPFIRGTLLKFFGRLVESQTYTSFCALLRHFVVITTRKLKCNCVVEAERVLRAEERPVEEAPCDMDSDDDEFDVLPPKEEDETTVVGIFGADAVDIYADVQVTAASMTTNNTDALHCFLSTVWMQMYHRCHCSKCAVQ